MRAAKLTIRKYYKYKIPADGFRLLNYIESTGTQYIDTKIVPSSNTILEIKEAQTSYSPISRSGWGSSGSAESFFWGHVDNSSKASCSVSSNWTTVNLADYELYDPHIFYLKSGQQSMDGVTYGTSTIGSTATSGQTLYLMALHTEYADYIQYARCCDYYGKIWTGNTLVRDYVAVEQISNGSLGLYDQVNSLFYPNQGTGSFISGGYDLAEGTEFDYDFYKDVLVYKVIKENDIHKALRSWEKGQYYGN